MKLLTDEAIDCASPLIRAFYGARFRDGMIDLAAIEREIELATEGPWKFTDPHDEPE